MNSLESVLFWATTLLLGAAFFGSLLSFIFRKPGAFRLATHVFGLATLTLTALGIVRWVRAGHPPFVTMFESMITAVWFALVLFQVVRARLPQISVLLVPVSAIALLLMGWSNSLSQEASPLSAALSNVWLFVHASFATAGAAAFLIAASYAAVYLVGAEKLANLRNVVPVMPDYPTLPRSMLNFLIFGLILWGVMIASGSIWAHSAWGRYWAWDPIEIWSLISWLLYGLVIHARLTFRLPQRAFCILTVAAAITVVFSLWGVQYVYETIHTYG